MSLLLWTTAIRYNAGQRNDFIEIKDNGCGIPKAHLENIYDPSFTLKGSKDISGSYRKGIKGTGYGLANVKKYIEQHNGVIKVDSHQNSGTTVTISLPVAEKMLSTREKAKVQTQTDCFEKYILLVEDEKAISDILHSILTNDPCNHKVDVAETGKAAIELFYKNRYDCISLDYILPGDVNGMDVYRHIREINQKIPILFVSGNIEFLESIKDLKEKDPFCDHLSKPCKNMDYLNGLNQLISKAVLHE